MTSRRLPQSKRDNVSENKHQDTGKFGALPRRPWVKLADAFRPKLLTISVDPAFLREVLFYVMDELTCWIGSVFPSFIPKPYDISRRIV